MSQSTLPNAVLPSWMGDVDLREIGFPLPVDRSLYTKVIEIAYKETPRGALHLDAYRPRDAERVPLVVMIHGGAWRGGSRFAMGIPRWAGYLASAGLAVASIDYRLAPDTSYPDSFGDCLDAIDWCVEHAEALGADPERVGLWGDSAGGHLALLVATSQTRPDFTGPRLRSGGARLRAVVAWYPPTDLLRLHEAESRNSVLGIPTVLNFVGVDPASNPARWREASPLEQAHAGMPPAMLLQGTRDLLVPHHHTTRFAERLAELGAAHQLHVVADAVHGFDRIAPSEQTRALIAASRDFLLERLGAASPAPRAGDGPSEVG